nr:uncharacterized protein LOC127310628 [Lolium perenne]
MPLNWKWGHLPLSAMNPPTADACERFPRIAEEVRAPFRRRDLDKVDPDPYVIWTKSKMSRSQTPRPAAPSANANPQVVERATPLQAECGAEFLEKLTSEGRKKKAPTPEAGSSEIPPAKRSRVEIGGKTVTTKRYRKREMPVATGPPLKISKSASGMRPETSGDAARGSPPPQPSPTPSGAGNPSASPLGGQHKFEKKKKKTFSSPSKAVPDFSEPANSAPAKDAPEAPVPPKTGTTPPPAAPVGKPTAAKPTPPESGKLTTQQLAAVVTAATDPSSSSRTMVLHTARAVVVASETASAQVGRITEFQRQGADLGHLLDYAEKWNRADLTPATRGLGKDKLPVVDPSGPRSTGQHFGQLRRAAKEFDNAWHDASTNVTSMVDTRKQLFEELLWEYRELSEAHNKCQALPEVSFEDLSAELAAFKAEKEQLTSAHREMKEQAMQAELRHARELKEAKSAAEAKLDETLKEYTDSTAGLRKELEEETAAPDKIAQLTTDQADYDRMVMQIDALACRIFPDSQAHAVANVTEHRATQNLPSPDAP